MKKLILLQLLIILGPMFLFSCQKRVLENNIYTGQTLDITPNQFKGSDTQRIQSAINKAKGTTNQIIIPSINTNGTNIWLLDSAILLPSNMTVILENCTLQLSDLCRDNMFRSDNVGIGITEPKWNENIHIIGIGDVYLKGANNPRSTGDAGRTLTLNSEEENIPGNTVSYGSDAGKEGVKQTGDWRNIMILMGYVDGFELKNVNIVNAHCWSVSFERTINATVANITYNCPSIQIINNKERFVANRDGIDLRHGCQNIRIDNISGKTGDDFIALSILGLYSSEEEPGTLNSTMATSTKYMGPEDETKNIYITNLVCECERRAVAIRANDVASINNVYIDGIMYQGGFNALLVGEEGWGVNSQPGKINNIHATNINGNGLSLIQIGEAIADCSFMNGLYTGYGNQIILYIIDENKTTNIITQNLIKLN